MKSKCLKLTTYKNGKTFMNLIRPFKIDFLGIKSLTKSLSVILIIFIFSSCASIVSRSTWPLTVNTNPNGANIEITNKSGAIVYKGTTPATMTLKSGAGFFAKESYKIKLTLDGYSEKIIPVECTLNGWYIGNIIFGGLIGLLVIDPATGAMYKLDREFINETLTESISSNQVSLKIMSLNDLPESMKAHLVSIK
jgi:hypothetical protein